MSRNTLSYALWAPEMVSAGGVQSYMWRLWEVLQFLDGKEGVRVGGLSLNDKTCALANFPNVTTKNLAGADRSKWSFILKAFGREGRAQIVIVGHVNQSPVAWLAKHLGIIEDYIVVLHGFEAWERASWLRRRSMKKAGALIATTKYTALQCCKANDLPLDLFRILPLCADPAPETPHPTFALDGDWPILFVGRLARSERYKGLDTVIKAVARLNTKGRRIKLHVVGDGDDLNYHQTLSDDLLPDSDSVEFHGRLSGSKLQAAYRSSKAFVLPSAKEGFGIVFLEAMRYGIPCIGGAHGGTPEVFKDGPEGLLVQFNDVDALENHLDRLLRFPDLAQTIGNSGRRRFDKDYNFDAFLNRWIKLLTPRLKSISG